MCIRDRASIHANGNLAVAGVGTINGGLNVGAGSTFTGNLLPETDGTRDIGATGLEWNDLYIDGEAHIDTLDVDGAAFVTTKLSVGTGVTAFANGNLAVAGIATINGLLDVNGGISISGIDENKVVFGSANGGLQDSSNLTFDGSTLAVTGDQTVSGKITVGSAATISSNGNAAFAGIVTVGGNLYVTGDIHYDEVSGRNLNISGISTFTSIGSNLIPDADGTRNIGAATSEWGDLYIDGTANIDTLDVDGTSNFADDVTLVAAGSSTILFDASAREIVFQDNLKAKFGTGSDLAIYHDSLNSYVTNSTGAIYIFNNETIIKNAANTATSLYANANDSVSLWFNNSKKVETTSGGFNVTGITTFSDRINVVSGVSTFADNAKLTFGTQADLTLSHNGTDSNILGSTGDLYIQNTGAAADDINIRAQDDINLQVDNGEAGIDIIGGGSVILYHHNNARVTTTDDGADVGGTASIKIPVGTTAQRNASPADGDIRYNTDLKSYEGYGNSAWGGLGGGTEIDTSVSSTAATSITTFVHAEHRSAYFRVQIVQGSAYQVGRYLLIHDGTTVTIIEESAIATGSMLGTITAAIVSSNVIIYVTMDSSASATVTSVIDKITV